MKQTKAELQIALNAMQLERDDNANVIKEKDKLLDAKDRELQKKYEQIINLQNVLRDIL